MNILVVGDIMLDMYIYGFVNRISPEAPVPVFDRSHERKTLGGCGNVAVNLSALGADVDCLSWVGDDSAGSDILNLILKRKIGSLTEIYGGVKTTVKSRLIDSQSGQQLIRVDDEAKFTVGVDPKKVFTKKYDVVVVSDYGKGAIDGEVMTSVKNCGAPVIVDPFPKHSWLYDRVFMITPNEKEYYDMDHTPECEYLVTTLGNRGMRVDFRGVRTEIPSNKVKVYDVQGAGDTVVATIAFCIGMGMETMDAIKIANECAGYVVTQPGTAFVPIEVFNEAVASV